MRAQKLNGGLVRDRDCRIRARSMIMFGLFPKNTHTNDVNRVNSNGLKYSNYHTPNELLLCDATETQILSSKLRAKSISTVWLTKLELDLNYYMCVGFVVWKGKTRAQQGGITHATHVV